MTTPTCRAALADEHAKAFELHQRSAAPPMDAAGMALWNFNAGWAAARSALALEAVPPGFVMVPLEPTGEMKWAGKRAAESAIHVEADAVPAVARIYAAMLASAPQPQTKTE